MGAQTKFTQEFGKVVPGGKINQNHPLPAQKTIIPCPQEVIL